ncbi:GFA family protein [Roseobacter sp. S98]|uniref:GFA family protein n=1 Tax=Roseobacter algicola (ex Choi et al. 2025) (nom. illeg.) TaxID=3092138 RepID=UPI0035C67510
MTEATTLPVTGRCYCGHIRFHCTEAPQTVAYCHCTDCRRASGGPVAAFAAFDCDHVHFTPDEGKPISITPGVVRTFCDRCGASLTGRYDYLPGQVYLSIGIIDQADQLMPDIHAHASQQLPWLHIEDDLPRADETAAEFLQPSGSLSGQVRHPRR